MCGIVGYIKKSACDDESIIKKMTDAITHRGPDSDGYFIDDNICFGFRRLSIIDLRDCANQPMYNEDRTKVLVFNGEIYNYKELRATLVEKGYHFVSETDSEVLIHGYEEWKEDLVNKLRGMYAFAIWNEKNEELFIARDIFGIKPLYYTQNTTDGSFIFGSEIKSFLENPHYIKELNKEAVKPYLSFQYNPLDETFFKGVYKLQPGHFLKYRQGEITIKRYYEPDFKEEDNTLEYYKEKIIETVQESIDVHLNADVRVGSFLSGGVDSSFIAALAKPQDTFSVGFKDYEGIYNETDIAKDLSQMLGFKHHQVLITAKDCFDKIGTIQFHSDEPHANLSTVPLFFLTKLASEYVTVVLSGEGADELFGGYTEYGVTPNMMRYKKLPFGLRRAIRNRTIHMNRNRYTRFFTKGGEMLHESFIGQAKVFEPDEAESILTDEYRHGSNAFDISKRLLDKYAHESVLNRKQLLDMNLWLPGDILLKADKMSDAHSLELRVPFLDKQVLELAMKLPERLRVDGGTYKYALREAAKEVLPEAWAKRKKVGFSVPLRFWLKEDTYYHTVKEMFEKDFTKEFFEVSKIKKLLDDHYNGISMNQRYIWNIYTFLVWYEEYFIKR